MLPFSFQSPLELLTTPTNTPMQPNTLMLTDVVSYLPSARHLSLVCSAGSYGYHALKEMMRNGKVGKTLLLESEDLRDVEDASNVCSLLYIFNAGRDVGKLESYHAAIPITVTHIHACWDTPMVPPNYFNACKRLTTIRLEPLSHFTQISWAFLSGCSGLATLDLSPLSQVTSLEWSFLQGCSGLSTIDLTPLSQVTSIEGSFLEGCTGLTSIDLSPLSNLKQVERSFLQGCTGLTSVDLTPFSRVKVVQWAFLQD